MPVMSINSRVIVDIKNNNYFIASVIVMPLLSAYSLSDIRSDVNISIVTAMGTHKVMFANI